MFHWIVDDWLDQFVGSAGEDGDPLEFLLQWLAAMNDPVRVDLRQWVIGVGGSVRRPF